VGVHGRGHSLGEPGESLFGQRIQQRLPIDEVAARRTMADARLPGELAQRQSVDPAVAEHDLCLLQQHLAQIPVMERLRRHRASLPDN
jgi:hypothetical protein